MQFHEQVQISGLNCSFLKKTEHICIDIYIIISSIIRETLKTINTKKFNLLNIFAQYLNSEACVQPELLFFSLIGTLLFPERGLLLYKQGS